MAFQILQTLYWLALAAWFGGVLFVMLAAPVVFRTVADANPILPTVLAVNLERQHATLLSSTIVANLLSRLLLVQVICAVAVAVLMLIQLAFVDLYGNNGTAAIVRAALLLGAALLAAYDRYFLWPKIMKHRDEYVAHADEPDVANPAHERFHALQRHSENLLMGTLALLLGLVLFSANITPKPTAVLPPDSSAPVSLPGLTK